MKNKKTIKVSKKFDVAVVIGSKSDSEIIKDCIDILKKFKISFDLKIISAHRSPNYLEKYIESFKKAETKVVVTAAGKAAHLGGVIASKVVLPVIGIPIKTSDLGGLDSLLSIVQMPKNIPVATVAINGSLNAGLLAIQILALGDKTLTDKLKKFKMSLETEIVKLNS